MKLRSPRHVRGGFTLIELLLVIGIIAILAAIVIVAINPTKQLGDARNAQRRSDINTILNAVYQWSIDHNGLLPGNENGGTNITSGVRQICKDSYDPATCLSKNSVNLRMLSGAYVVHVPVDPQVVSTATGTNYFIHLTGSASRITVEAHGVEPASGQPGNFMTVTR